MNNKTMTAEEFRHFIKEVLNRGELLISEHDADFPREPEPGDDGWVWDVFDLYGHPDITLSFVRQNCIQATESGIEVTLFDDDLLGRYSGYANEGLSAAFDFSCDGLTVTDKEGTPLTVEECVDIMREFLSDEATWPCWIDDADYALANTGHNE